MARYGKLLATIWSDPDFTALDPHSQQLYCMLLSHTTRNHAGVLPLTVRRWARASAGVSAVDVECALVNLARARFVVVDDETEEVLIRTYVAHDRSYRTPNSRKSIINFAESVESPLIRLALSIELSRIDEPELQDCANLLVETIPQGLRQPLAQGLDEPLRQPFLARARDGDGYVSQLNPSPRAITNNHQPPPTKNADRSRTELARIAALNGQARSAAADEIVCVFAEQLGTSLPMSSRAEIGVEIDKLIRDGIDHDHAVRTLHEWQKSDSFSPSQIRHYVAKAARTRAFPGDDKADGWMSMLTAETPQELEP